MTECVTRSVKITLRVFVFLRRMYGLTEKVVMLFALIAKVGKTNKQIQEKPTGSRDL